MKNLLAFALATALVVPAFAEDALADTEDDENEATENTVEVEAPRKQVGVWPAFFAICEIPSAAQAPDVCGLRLTIPYSSRQESVTGFDIGFWGRAQYFEGFMCSIFRNDVKDQLTGVQVGIYNSAAQADLFGVQAGIWNDVGAINGGQVGLVNVAGEVNGIQVGIINRAEEMYGFQVGVINIIRDAEIRFCPIVNVGF